MPRATRRACGREWPAGAYKEPMDLHGIEAAEVVLACADVQATAAFLTERLGFRVDAVLPADDPLVIVVSGHGVRLRLERRAGAAPVRLRLACRDPWTRALAGPASDGSDGLVIELVDAAPPLVVPPSRSAFIVTRVAPDASWKAGRAGMRYRDLIPGRLGGRWIASHIQVPRGGAVPDYVHFHEVRAQLIYCRRGWVRLVYEDQGEAFTMCAGDLVLQPPRIRHRVLECSPGLEVVEVASPARHATYADHALPLPNGRVDAARDFAGQRFVRHERSAARGVPWRVDGMSACDLGVAAGTGGLASACVARLDGTPRAGEARWEHDDELLLLYVLNGSVVLDVEGHGTHALGPDDAVVVPPRTTIGWRDAAADLELLEVTAPAASNAPR